MMNVAIVGNSNCVFSNGFSHGVARYVSLSGGVVRNYSLGGSCCALHIYSFHDRYKALCDSELVIIDSLVIDSFHWRRGIIRKSDLLLLIDDLYALYSHLPGKVVSVLFPIERFVANYWEHPIYQAHTSAAKKYGVDVLDLYRLLFRGLLDYNNYFMQPSHIRTDISREIGYRLVSECSKGISKRKDMTPLDSPYKVLKREVLGELDTISVKSSYYEAVCYRLDRELSLDSQRGKQLIGALHWNKTSNSRFVVATNEVTDVVQFRSNYAFFEVLNVGRKIEPNTTIRAGSVNECVTQTMAGKKRLAGHDVPQIIGLLVRARKINTSAREIGNHTDLSDRVGDVFG